ncbi:MAG: SDR family NAD(P)-dependent oxidoreductase [Anaerolineae bacterium]|nr:SDR family NAD(P)-dependent oxidoreductase [Anaerolineae bacterium]
MRLLFFPFLGVNDSQLQKQLAGKTVLITGASYGIGECLAARLASTEAHLILVARTAEKLIEVKERVEAQGGRADIYPCDLRNEQEIETLLAELHQLPQGIDIVVNNAGKSIRRSLFDSLDRFHDFTRTMNLNYLGPVQLMLSLVPVLVARRGHVINISSISVLLAPMPKWAAYQASKSAFDQWFRCAAPELNTRGVSTTTIYLPLVRTRMIEPTQAYQNMPAMQPEQIAQLICRAIIARKRTYAPWWLIFGQLASTLFRWPWEVITSRQVK